MEKEVTICDECGKEDYLTACLGCGVEHCFKCQRKCGVEYEHSIYISGSGDGYFCHECDIHPPKKIEELHQAYLNIRNLWTQSEEWYKHFEMRKKRSRGKIGSIAMNLFC